MATAEGQVKIFTVRMPVVAQFQPTFNLLKSDMHNDEEACLKHLSMLR